MSICQNHPTRRAVLAAASLCVAGANDRIRCATIGAGSRGYYLTEKFGEQGAEMAAICDVYEPRVRKGLAAAAPGARGYIDYRHILDDKSIDAVIIATPDHTHAQVLIDAVEAGKDAYVEKPLAHTAEEGFRMIKAVRRNGRVVQVGTQRRSYGLYYEAAGIVHSGIL
ncbi:MAG: Gfo/Idh/MocA family oxidoreductase, partial [Bryobacteraceae bacterium]|nr:Gfo/Idh/MocA family oxidoreductase [Bryobacteraceae bacterium]